MKKNLLILVSLITGSLCVFSCNSTKKKPNIIYILADDLGYGGLGIYGQEKIETPNIDQLAVEGMRFTQHYSGAPVCAPARCVLLTGLHTGKSQVRGNDEWRERGDVGNYLAMLADSTLEGQRPLKEGTPTIGRALQSVGYTTAITGKWGLGAPHTAGTPNNQGFDYFYGYNCQRQAHTLYPVHLWKNDRREYLNNDTVAPHAPPLASGVDPYDPESYAAYNLTDWEYKGEPIMLIGASDRDNLWQWTGKVLTDQLDRMKAAGGNYVRNTMSDRDEGDSYAAKLLPNGKYDLGQWNEEYWDKLRFFLDETQKRDIIAQITLCPAPLYGIVQQVSPTEGNNPCK